MKHDKYTVQFAIIKEVQVEATDELQAEREAFNALGRLKENAVALRVLEQKDGGGALASDDLSVNWKFARENFGTIDPEWVSG